MGSMDPVIKLLSRGAGVEETNGGGNGLLAGGGTGLRYPLGGREGALKER